MLTRLRPRLTYANVMASIAVFLALGGTAYAVAANSVGAKQLKNGAVTKPKLASNAVGAGKVIDGSLLKKDFKPGQLPQGHVRGVVNNDFDGTTLPYQSTVTTHGGNLLVFLSGSGSQDKAAGPLATTATLSDPAQAEDLNIGYAQGFTSEIHSHKALVPDTEWVSNVSAGTHTLRVFVSNGIADGSDHFHLTILEFPR